MKGSEAGQVSQSVRANRAGARALFKSKFKSIFRFGTFVLGYLTLVVHINKVWSVILQGSLVGHIQSVI